MDARIRWEVVEPAVGLAERQQKPLGSGGYPQARATLLERAGGDLADKQVYRVASQIGKGLPQRTRVAGRGVLRQDACRTHSGEFHS